MEMDSMPDIISRCMDAIVEHVGTVELGTFIYYVRSQSFDYTRWQREHFDAMTPEDIDAAVKQHSAEHPFRGKKSAII